MKRSRCTAFSLVEVTIALGVVAVSLLALFALIPIGLKGNQNSLSQTAATSIINSVIADLRATPKTSTTSAQFGITFGTAQTLYFNSEGTPATAITATSRYRLTITFPPAPPGTMSATFADFKLSWPAAAAAANTLGSCEMFAAFDRH